MRLTSDDIAKLREYLFDENGGLHDRGDGRMDIQEARAYAPHIQVSGAGVPEQWGLPPAEHYLEVWLSDICLERPWGCCPESWIQIAG